jgi:hypothetical protein
LLAYRKTSSLKRVLQLRDWLAEIGTRAGSLE